MAFRPDPLSPYGSAHDPPVRRDNPRALAGGQIMARLFYITYISVDLAHCEIVHVKSVKGIYLSKALTCMKFFLYKRKMLFFIKETDTFGYIVV